VRYIPSDTPAADPMLFLPRRDNHEYFVTDGVDRFYVMSNDGAENFEILEAPLDDTSQDAWKTLVPHRDDVLIEGISVFEDFVVVDGTRQGLNQIEVLDRESVETHAIEFEEEEYRASTGENHNYDSMVFRYS
jgi:oligopeptidase B